MTRRSMINRGIEVRTKDKSIGRDSSGQHQASFQESEGVSQGGETVVLPDDDSSFSGGNALLGNKLFQRCACDKQAAVAMAGRVALMLVGIAVMAFGIDVVVKAHLGNSPISAFPYVMSYVTPAISFGTLMLLWQCFLVLLQIAILRREFRFVDLLQIPISVFFGICIDVFTVVISPITLPNYASSWVCLLIGMATLALGITMTVISATVMNCGEAVVQAVVRKTGIQFGTMKVIFDISCALAAALLGFICLGHIEGVREGTVVCAACTGLIVNVYMGLYKRLSQQSKQ